MSAGVIRRYVWHPATGYCEKALLRPVRLTVPKRAGQIVWADEITKENPQ